MTPALICLALAVYYEARSEPLLGQVAVAEVILNRVHDPAYPNNICEVVHEGGTARYRCQFSYWCDGKSETPAEGRAWRRAKVITKLTYSGVLSAGIGDATNYHADYASPYWRDQMELVATIGRHNFYFESSSSATP